MAIVGIDDSIISSMSNTAIEFVNLSLRQQSVYTLQFSPVFEAIYKICEVYFFLLHAFTFSDNLSPLSQILAY